MGASIFSLYPATTTTKSVDIDSDRIAADRKVSLDREEPSTVGGQVKSALSRPMREDSPAAKINPAKLTDRDMERKITERGEKVSDRKIKISNYKGH